MLHVPRGDVRKTKQRAIVGIHSIRGETTSPFIRYEELDEKHRLIAEDFYRSIYRHACLSRDKELAARLLRDHPWVRFPYGDLAKNQYGYLFVKNFPTVRSVLPLQMT